MKSKLLANYKNLAYNVCKKLSICPPYSNIIRDYRINIDDLSQVAFIGALKYINNYDKTKSKLITYLYICMESEAKKYLNKQIKKKRQKDKDTISISSIVEPEKGTILSDIIKDNRQLQKINNINFKIDLDKILSDVVKIVFKKHYKRNKEIFKSLVLYDYKMKDIKEKYNLSVYSINKIKQLIVAELKKNKEFINLIYEN